MFLNKAAGIHPFPKDSWIFDLQQQQLIWRSHMWFQPLVLERPHKRCLILSEMDRRYGYARFRRLRPTDPQGPEHSQEGRRTEALFLRGLSVSSHTLSLPSCRAADTWQCWTYISISAEALKNFACAETVNCKSPVSCQLYFRTVPNGHMHSGLANLEYSGDTGYQFCLGSC